MVSLKPRSLSKRLVGFGVVLLLAMLCSCFEREEMQRGFVVIAPDSYDGATLTVDGKPVGQLRYLSIHGSLFEDILTKIYGDSPANHVVSARINFAVTPFVAGRQSFEFRNLGK